MFLLENTQKMATQEDRTLGSGMPIPKWMKSKINDKFDFGQTAFSPTELDDSFMYYYRHPQGGNRETESKVITTNISDKITVSKVGNTKSDFYPPPCQKYLHNITDAIAPPQITPEMKIKSQGVDDGFKGEAAKCGSSIIRVASQMVSGKVVHGFSIKENEGCEQNQTIMEKYDGRTRRGSKSLPASPLISPNTSPKTNRRVVNKYFTGAFTDVDKSKGGWLLSNLLARREMSQSVGYIPEEMKEEMEKTATTASVDDLSSDKSKTHVFKAKPSELREMNFWSPTSM